MPPRRVPLLAAVAVATALLAGCTGGAGAPTSERPDRPSALPGTPVATADAGRPTDDAGALGSARPELTDDVEAAVGVGREVFVRPSCTPDAGGQRLCWNESALPYQLDPGARPLTLTAARTDLDTVADAWFVEVEVAPADAVAEALDAARARDSRLALTTTGGDLVALLPGEADLRGTSLRLSGLDKPAAYDLVQRLVDLAATR
ncbi:hypothetical protein [Nocardioides perillae]|uniref:Preprotein translocase subunit SecD n=1 Tax=Nocardioides perillae TaxID=1119534 RepID=A0A7Y9RPR9_9ACTN|nr:hypothetical protein [Nocardioides perillae]NYG54322.1 hypothetical protein [Nocardioides perillae]